MEGKTVMEMPLLVKKVLEAEITLVKGNEAVTERDDASGRRDTAGEKAEGKWWR